LTRKARKADRFAAQADEMVGQYVPNIYWSHTTDNLLTVELVEATPLSEIILNSQQGLSLAQTPDETSSDLQINPRVIAQNLLGNFMHQILSGRYVHCNPTPASLSVLRDNTIVYFDWQAVERIDTRLARQQLEVISAARAGDFDSLFHGLWDWTDGPYGVPIEFEASIYRRFSDWWESTADKNSLPSERSLLLLISGVLDDFRKYHISAPEALLAYYHAFVTTIHTVEVLAPKLDVEDVLARSLQKNLTERIEKKIDMQTLSHTVLEYEEFLVSAPHQLRELMRLVRQNQSAVVKTVEVNKLQTWDILQSLTTWTILAIVIAWIWTKISGEAFNYYRVPAIYVAIAVCSLLVMRRGFQLRYERCAMGSRRMRYPQTVR
jgi:predicted unusual protein kinase regulating ubiquinone biosynthesis (AarF/ABC1/UbiB family)